MLSILKMLNFFLVAEALTGLIYHRPTGKDASFQFTPCLKMAPFQIECTKETEKSLIFVTSNLSVIRLLPFKQND